MPRPAVGQTAAMTWDLWWPFLGAAIAISVSPGVAAIQSMATGLAHGVRRGYWSIAGLEIGLMASWPSWHWASVLCWLRRATAFAMVKGSVSP